VNNDPPHRPAFYPEPAEIAPRRRSNLAIDSAPVDQHLLKPAAGQAILPPIPIPGLPSFRRSIDRLGANGGENWAMKTFTIATLILSLLAMPVYAQGRRPQQAEEKKAKQDTSKADEKAYKAALERIPEPKEKYDPWAVTKPAEPAKKPK
jgi:hypothetical protein